MLQNMATCSSDPIRKWLREKCCLPESKYSPARFHLLCCFDRSHQHFVSAFSSWAPKKFRRGHCKGLLNARFLLLCNAHGCVIVTQLRFLQAIDQAEQHHSSLRSLIKRSSISGHGSIILNIYTNTQMRLPLINYLLCV